MFNNLKFLGTILAVSLLIIVGTFLYAKKAPKLANTQVAKNQPATQVANNSPKLPPLPASASGKEVEKFIEAVQAQSQQTDTITIKDCMASPKIVKIKTGAQFNIQNNDKVEIKLFISSKSSYTVEAGKKAAVKMEASPGIYQYRCLQTSGTNVSDAGILEVTR